MATCFVEVGLLLLVVPWSTFWDRNSVLEAVPAVHALARSPFVRGAVSGLGLVNLGAGVTEMWCALAVWWRSRGAAPPASSPVPPTLRS